MYKRADHCVSRKNIDPDALKVLYRLSSLGYTAYLVGGGVRDLLMGRKPKDFDVGTSAKPNEVKRAFRNCFLIGRRFRLAHVRFGEKVIETATFRQNSQSVGEIIEHAAEGPLEDNTFGTPETDAYRRDFTVNGLFYDIKDFSVIRLGFTIERKTLSAMKKYHSCILTAAVPRVCEEVFRLFPYGKSAEAFRLMWETGLLADLLPDLSAHIDRAGGKKCLAWKYLASLDKYELMMSEKGFEVSNGLRAAVLMTTMLEEDGKDGAGRRIMQQMMERLKIPKATYFTAVPEARQGPLHIQQRFPRRARLQQDSKPRARGRRIHTKRMVRPLRRERQQQMNEELEQLIQELKSTLPWFLAAGIIVAGYYGVRKYVADKRAAASEIVSTAYTTDELEDAVAKFGSSKSGGILRLRLAKSYFDAGSYESALDIYNELDGKAPDGFADVPAVGKAQCLEGLGKFDEAAKAYDAFAAANEKSYLALTAKLGSARCAAQAGNRDKALEALEALKAAAADDEIAKSRIETTIDLVKRYEKREERSLFDAADAAQKQIEGEAAKKEEAKAEEAPKAEAPKAEAPKAEEAKTEPAKAE